MAPALDVKHRVIRGHAVEPVGCERKRGHLALDERRAGHGLAREFEPTPGDVEPDASRREVRERPRAVATPHVENGRRSRVRPVGPKIRQKLVYQGRVGAVGIAPVGVRLRHLVPRPPHLGSVHATCTVPTGLILGSPSAFLGSFVQTGRTPSR
jgi:hypothetical protein